MADLAPLPAIMLEPLVRNALLEDLGRAGAVVVPISHDAAEGEILYRLEDASCRTVFTSAARKNLVTKLSADRNESAIIVIVGEGAGPADVTLEWHLGHRPKDFAHLTRACRPRQKRPR